MQCVRIAVAGREQRRAVLADAQAAVDVVVVDRLRPGEQLRRDGGGRRPRRGERRLPGSPHLVQRPAQVDGGGPRGQQAARGLLERGPERRRVGRTRGGGLGGRERDAPGRRDADGRGAADRHVGDAVRDLPPGAAGDVALLLRQRELVDEHDLAGQDLDGAHAQARTAGPAALAGAGMLWLGAHRPRGPGRVSRDSGALVPGGEVLGLLLGEGVALDRHRLELEPGDLVVDVLGHHVHLVLEAGVVLHHELGGE